MLKNLAVAFAVVPFLSFLSACQTSTTPVFVNAKSGESDWIKWDQRDQFIHQMQQNDLVPIKIKCRYTKEEFPKVEYKIWTKKVPGLSPRAKKVVTEFGFGSRYHPSKKDDFKNKPTIHVMYYPRMQQYHSCIIPSPYY